MMDGRYIYDDVPSPSNTFNLDIRCTNQDPLEDIPKEDRGQDNGRHHGVIEDIKPIGIEVINRKDDQHHGIPTHADDEVIL